MSIKIYTSRKFEHTHERIMFDDLCEKLFSAYHDDDDLHILIANLHVDGKELDAVYIKQDAITVIEFKNYGGSFEFYENGDWPITSIENNVANSTVVKGGASGNPYQQVRQNKFSLLNFLNDYARFNSANFGHITGLVLFGKDIQFNHNYIPAKIASWFHICDIESAVQKLNQITSSQINLSNDEIKDFVRIFNLHAVQEVEIPSKLSKQLNLNNQQLDTFENSETVDIQNIIEKETVLEIQNTNIEQKSITDALNEIGYNIIYSNFLPERLKVTKQINDLELSYGSTNYLNTDVKGEIYLHQYEAILRHKNDKNICVSTSTNSGKSLIFYTTALETIASNPSAKILAIYPLKALAYQQEEKWNNAILKSDQNITIGRIDGTVDSGMRMKILRESNIICVTPDILHAWFLSQLDKKNIQSFFRNLSLIIIDEIHVYRGVFGSNASYLFRRINYACEQLRLKDAKQPRYLCASATINNTEILLDQLIGVPFEIIDQSFETSPKHKTDVYLLDPTEENDPYSKVSELLNHFSKDTNKRSITFVDSRKAVEQIATITDRFENNQIYPYRSGYENQDRITIQDQLQKGHLKGVISTSALEMGIDIGHLNIAVLYGVPSSQTSFMQRIGRVGRGQDCAVFIINDKSINSERIFKNPQNIFDIPPVDTALYLENEYIQYIHALCLVGIGGNSEYDNLKISNTKIEDSSVKFPKDFLVLCDKVKESIEPANLKILISNSNNEDPHYLFPLRDIEKQFKIELLEGRDITPLGEMTKSQQMREAYPGAVYYHMMKSYRVTGIQGAKIQLCREAKYFTRPMLQIAPFPNIISGLIDQKRISDLKIIECNLDVYENIFGYYERKGNQDEINISYPNRYYSKKCYSRRIVTTGVVIGGEIFNTISTAEKRNAIANIFYNVFIGCVPYEKQDVDYCIGTFNKINCGNGFIAEDSYLCIYDKTYGSLRLTSKIMYLDILLKITNTALEWMPGAESVYTKEGEEVLIDDEIITFFEELKEELLGDDTMETLQKNDASNQNNSPAKVTIIALEETVKLINSEKEYLVDWVYPDSNSEISTILYDLKDIENGEMISGVRYGEIIFSEGIKTSEYDLIRKRIL